MTTGDDKDLQRLLDGDHPVSKAWRDLPGARPPAALDEAILAAARTEARRPLRPRWLVPVSVAATVVLGVGLSLRQIDVSRPSVSDMTAPAASMDMTQEAAAGSDQNRVARQASGRFIEPVPKPGVEELLQTEPLDGARREKASVDVEALRQRALADTMTFTPPPSPTLDEAMVASEAQRERWSSLARSPTPTTSDEAMVAGKPSAEPEPPYASSPAPTTLDDATVASEAQRGRGPSLASPPERAFAPAPPAMAMAAEGKRAEVPGARARAALEEAGPGTQAGDTDAGPAGVVAPRSEPASPPMEADGADAESENLFTLRDDVTVPADGFDETSLIAEMAMDDDDPREVRRLAEQARSGALAIRQSPAFQYAAKAETDSRLAVLTKDAFSRRRLDLILRLHRHGETEAARILFDDLLDVYPDTEVPKDFPLRPPAPEFEVSPTP